MSAQETCSTCRFFLPDQTPGICRRYPPAVSMERIQARVIGQQSQLNLACEFPRMQPHGWCGEWAGRVQ